MDIDLTWHVIGQIAGWIAAGMTLAAFSMRTMVPLRGAALGANLFFVIYGLTGPYWQPLVLHGLLLPFNLYRLVEILRRTRELAGDRGAPITAEMIAPYARRKDVAAGAVVFDKGDRADNLYMIVEGAVRIVEVDVTLGRGEIFGEIAFFAPDRTRTGTARATTATRLLVVDEAALTRLYTTSPVFGFRLVELITARLIAAADPSRTDRVTPGLQSTDDAGKHYARQPDHQPERPRDR